MMLIDSARHFDGPLRFYEIHDYSALHSYRTTFEPVWHPTRCVGLLSPPRVRDQVLTWMGVGMARRVHHMMMRRQPPIERTMVASPIGLRAYFRYQILTWMGVGTARRVHRIMMRMRERRKPLIERSFSVVSLIGLRAFLRLSRGWSTISQRRVSTGMARVAKIMIFPVAAIGIAIERSVRIAISPLRRSSLAKSIWQLGYWLRAVNGVRGFLRAIKPDAIVLAEDNIETFSRAFVSIGRSRGIPSVIIPYTIPNPLEPAQFYRDNPLHQERSILARILTGLRSKWRLVEQGKALLRLPALKALAIEAMGLSTPAPWILNRGDAAVIALDSEVQRDVYVGLGFPKQQLSVVGDMNGEVLFIGQRERQERRRVLVDQLGLDGDRPLVVCAFPPDQYSGSSTEAFEFPTFEALIEAWMGSFRALGAKANVVIRPHPRLAPKRLQAFEGPGIRLTMVPTAELIPLCDLYVASISATIRWAIACGIPVINYDAFRYRYGDYMTARGVAHVESLSEFRDVLQRFVSDKTYAVELAQRQRSVMRRWGLVDEAFADRLAELVAETIEKGSASSGRTVRPFTVRARAAQ